MWKFLAGIVVGAVGAAILNDSPSAPEKVIERDVSGSIGETETAEGEGEEIAAV